MLRRGETHPTVLWGDGAEGSQRQCEAGGQTPGVAEPPPAELEGPRSPSGKRPMLVLKRWVLGGCWVSRVDLPSTELLGEIHQFLEKVLVCDDFT